MSVLESQPLIGKSGCPTWQWALAAGASLTTLAGGVVLKVENQMSGQSVNVDTLADLIIGVSTSVLAQSLLPSSVKTSIMNKVKRWTVPVFEIATNVYYNVTHNHLSEQIYYTPVVATTADSTTDDIFVYFTKKVSEEDDIANRKNDLLPMIEGDAKCTRRMLMNQSIILTCGVGLIALGYLMKGRVVQTTSRDMGITACAYALGAAITQQAQRLVDNARPRPDDEEYTPPRYVPWLHAILKFFQEAYPQGFAVSIVSSHPVGYGVSGGLLGIGNQLTRTRFQYHTPNRSDLSFVERIGSIWNTRKVDIGLNALFFLLVSGFCTWGEIAAGDGRTRVGVGAMFGGYVAGLLGTGVIDLLWKGGNSRFFNTLYYSLVEQPIFPFIYLFMQTKLIANDIYLDKASAVGYGLGLTALSAFGASVGGERAMQLSDQRDKVASTSLLGKSLLWFTTARRLFK